MTSVVEVEDLEVEDLEVEDRQAREEADLIAQVAAGNLGDAGLAEELVQECLIRLWRTAGKFDRHRGTVAAYLFVMARSIAADLRKRSSSRPLAPMTGIQFPPHPDSAERIVESLMVRDALGALSTAQREVLVLMTQEGLTQSQVAARLELPLGTVRTRTFHGLKALRVALAERGYAGRT
jgi:RNA polymerase sigma-70 factor (ECF subfamily)